MITFHQVIFAALALLLLLLEERDHCVVCYIHSLSPTRSTTRQQTSFRLHSSPPNILLGRRSTGRDDGDDDNKTNKLKRNNNRQEKIEFVNFWGAKISSDGNAGMVDPRRVPCVSTLDVHDGPLPQGAYLVEGKSEFDAKPTCRISMDVKADNIDTADDSDALVRKLQACIDAGLDTFRLHDQTVRSLAIIRKMNENTPSHIHKHWSVDLKIQSNTLSIKSDLRQSVLDLVEQTGTDALDSLKVDCDNFYAIKSLVPDAMALEIFDHLVELQREGWIRSIGVQSTESEKLRQGITTYFGDYIDFEEREGHLLLPPDLFSPQNNLRMSNVLAGGLLTDLYNSNDRRHGKIGHRPALPLLTKENINLLNVWSKRRKKQHKTKSSSSASIWKQYQDDVVRQLGWIALKYDVSISAITLRWALECGGNGEGSVVSSALTGIDFDDPKGEFAQKLIELRQVFRFQLDEEDKHILSDISAFHQNENQNDEEGFPDIDFNNPTLWL